MINLITRNSVRKMNNKNKNRNLNILRTFLKKIYSLNICLVLLLLAEVYKPKFALANQNKNIPTVDYLKKTDPDNFYILGPGDTLELKVSDRAKLLNQTFTINSDGQATLKRLKSVYVSGLTLKELKNILDKKYLDFVKETDVSLNIINYRPLNLVIDGEVLNPGMYKLPGSIGFFEDTKLEDLDSPLRNIEMEDISQSAENGGNLNSNNNVFFPTLVDVIKKAGGLTENADASKVTVIRKDNLSNGGGYITTTVNLLNAINGDDTSQNIRVLDGDKIKLSYSNEPIISQIRKSIKSNLNPRFINVYVGGRVENAGQIKINNSAVLTDAILLSGGTKVLKGPVRFLRYKSDGSIDFRQFRYRKRASRGSYKNPYLRNGDIVMVGKSSLNVANEVIGEITSPLQGIVSTYGLYKAITD